MLRTAALMIALSLTSPARAAAPLSPLNLAQIEKRIGGRLGIAVSSARGESQFDADFSNRADERFPLCSTFKFLLAAQILKRVDEGSEKLERVVEYSEKDLVDYSPVTKKHLARTRKGMTIGELCEAAIQYSDNTAANLLLNSVGSPVKLTEFLRSHGDDVTRLDRFEPMLNQAEKDLDTTTPRAMVGNFQRFLLGDALSKTSRQKLEGWLLGNTTGSSRLKAGLAPGWKIADKTGTCDQGTRGDVGILFPTTGPPVAIAVYFAGAKSPSEKTDAAFADIARALTAPAKPERGPSGP